MIGTIGACAPDLRHRVTNAQALAASVNHSHQRPGAPDLRHRLRISLQMTGTWLRGGGGCARWRRLLRRFLRPGRTGKGGSAVGVGSGNAQKVAEAVRDNGKAPEEKGGGGLVRGEQRRARVCRHQLAIWPRARQRLLAAVAARDTNGSIVHLIQVLKPPSFGLFNLTGARFCACAWTTTSFGIASCSCFIGSHGCHS